MTKYLKANFIKNTLLTACNDNKLRCYCGHEYTEDEVNSLDNKTLNNDSQNILALLLLIYSIKSIVYHESLHLKISFEQED